MFHEKLTEFDGGFCHPVEVTYLPDGRITPIQTGPMTGMVGGITLRQHYAGLALAALIQGYATAYGSPTNAPDEVVREAISYADLLIGGLSR